MTDILRDAPERVYDYDIDEVKSSLRNIKVEDIPYGPNIVKSVMMDAAHALNAQAARIEELEAAIKRQSGAAKTLRHHTLSEVQHLKDKDRSEYTATQTVESEREANAILTDMVEKLEKALTTARAEALKEAADVCLAAKSERDKQRIDNPKERLEQLIRWEAAGVQSQILAYKIWHLPSNKETTT